MRCYSADIPDEVPALLSKTNRVPSYKAIAIAILQNDHTFKSLGFSQEETELSASLIRDSKKERQLEMF